MDNNESTTPYESQAQPLKRRRGRPPRVRPAEPPPPVEAEGAHDRFAVYPAAPVAAPTSKTAMWGGYPIMPDDEMEHYGGDLAALDAYYVHDQNGDLMIGHVHPRVRAKLASWNSNRRVGTQPDLTPKGMLVNRHDPTLLYHFAYLTEDGGPHYQQTAMALYGRGYIPVTVADFYVHSSLRPILTPEDGTGRLTLGALKGSVTVVYAQDKASYDRWKREERKFSDAIQVTAEQKAAEIKDQLQRDGFDGVSTFSSVEEM